MTSIATWGLWACCALMALSWTAAWGTETENREIRVLPAPGPVTIDGKLDDWDLSGGIFGCDDVENARDRTFIWFHTMYDQNYLYLVGRLADSTPLNNRLSKAEGGGWGGDCLQVRLTTDRNLHITAWRDRDGLSCMDIYYGYFSANGKEGEVPDAIAAGAKMAFQVNPDGKGYVQEIAMPWALITRSAKPYAAGQTFRITFETRQSGKVGDLYAPKPDRIFTFRSFTSWGTAKVAEKAPVAPQPVRLADGREFPVTMANGQPKVDWTGVIVEEKLEGHIPITFTLPRDSYLSLAIQNAQGVRVRNLVSNRFFTAGTHTVQWDGLADGKENLPGKPVPAGKYTWKGITHDQFHLEYKGIYHNAGQPPWSNFSVSNDWGGDHGLPIAGVAGANAMYLGWSGGEASTQLIAVNLEGKKLWGARRSYSSTEYLCIDGNDLYAGPNGDTIYRLDAKTGAFKAFPSAGSVDLAIPKLPGQEKIIRPSGMAALQGKIYMSFAGQGQIARLDVKTGAFDRFYPVDAPGRLAWTPEKHLLVLTGKTVSVVNPDTGAVATLINARLEEPKGLTTGADGRIYVADWGKAQQVKVFSPSGKFERAVGRAGGRATLGPWQKDGFYRPLGLAVDAQGRLWVGENDETPKRWSIWSDKGKILTELFGPSHYGSDGGALNPDDPYLGVGVQCEWRTDPQTGQATCLGTISREEMCNVPFPLNAHSSRYLKAGKDWYVAQGLHRYYSILKIFRKLDDGSFRLAAVLGNAYQHDPKPNKPLAFSEHPLFAGHKGEVFAWSDANGDGQVQETEVSFAKLGATLVGGWQQLGVNADFTAYMPMSDGTIWRFPAEGFTKAGAPRYDLKKSFPTGVRNAGGYGSVMPSVDGDMFVTHTNPLQGATPDGAVLWTYPNDWNGVHGSHRSPTPKVGLLRGTFAVVGSAKLKNGEELFMINSNVGEWHCFTKDGLYVANLFALNPVDVRWPEKAEPGVLLDSALPGMGGEDFGGFFTGTSDGRAFLQCGKTGFWIVEMTGVDSLARLPGGEIEQPVDGVAKSQDWYSKRLQQTAGVNATTAVRFAPTIDGKVDEWTKTWFAGFDYDAKGEANIKAAVSYDDANLYLAYQVYDRTAPWKNTCTDPTQVYAFGDTVDFQLATDPNAPAKRANAAPGDLRLAIGNVNGKPTAVAYREKGPLMGGAPALFGSGVVHEFRVDSVAVLTDAKISVVTENDRYTVEAAIPLARLGITPAPGLTLAADFGVTYGNKDGTDVVLRKYWSNQNTAIVNDEVFELRIEPRNWGTLKFE